MDGLVNKRNVFSGNCNDTDKFASQNHQEVYYEGQILNDQTEKEEQKKVDVLVKKEKTGYFKAIYNTFF